MARCFEIDYFDNFKLLPFIWQGWSALCNWIAMDTKYSQNGFFPRFRVSFVEIISSNESYWLRSVWLHKLRGIALGGSILDNCMYALWEAQILEERWETEVDPAYCNLLSY